MWKITVHEVPPFLNVIVPNCNACGIARKKAKIHIAKINFTTRDSFDIVWDLQRETKT
jgi:hypothetical protein